MKKVIEDFNHLPIEEKEYALEVIKKQLIELKKEAIAKRAREASDNYKTGNINVGDIESLYKDLESDQNILGSRIQTFL